MAGPRPVRAALAACFALLGPSGPAGAAESAADTETDHLDPADDRGPRALGVFLRPWAAGLGVVGAEIGAAVGTRAVLALEVRWLALAPAAGGGLALGLSVFPTRLAFRGLYLYPRVEGWRAPLAGAVRAAVGAGLLVGYEWTAPVGATLRLGGGLTYAAWTGAPPSSPSPGVVPELDAAIGWVF